MNKAELVAALAKETGFTKKDTEAFLKAFAAVAKKELKAKEGKIQLAEVGTIKSVKRAARKVRNPRTGETMTSPACKVAKFVAAKALKDAINKK